MSKKAFIMLIKDFGIILNKLGSDDKSFSIKQKNVFETEVREKARQMRKTEYRAVNNLFSFTKTLKDQTISLRLEALPRFIT